MSSKISIFIPVYKEADLLDPLLSQLLSDSYGSKEIFVVIDEPTDKSLHTVKKFETSVNFILNGERKGKANVLNDVVKESDGEILLFLDSDVFIQPSKDSFLQVVSEETEKNDIIEIKKKVIQDSFLARIVHYDYLSFNSSNLIFSETIRRCLAFNGAAFAIKRETFESLGGFQRVVSEDLDMGLRAFLNGFRFKFIHSIEVYVKVSSSWRVWFNQRKRWGVGTAMWLKSHLRDILTSVRMYPKVLLPSLLLVLPAIPLFIITIFVPNEFYSNLFSLLFLAFAAQGGSFLYPFLLLISSTIFFRRAVAVFSSYLVYLFTFFLFARALKYKFEPLSFAFFYLVYSPVWFLILIVSIIKVYLSTEVNIDWKT